MNEEVNKEVNEEVRVGGSGACKDVLRRSVGKWRVGGEQQAMESFTTAK